MKRLISWSLLVALATCLVMPAFATTECDTDPEKVDFVPTVNATLLNALLASIGSTPIDAGAGLPAGFGGLCVDHNVTISADIFALPADEAAFTVTPDLGSLQVDLDIFGPFDAGVSTGGYHTSNCSSICVVDIPYLGELFNGCDWEGDLIGPIVGNLSASASWDEIIVTQVADTCVTGDCVAIHPLETSSAAMPGFDIDFTGIGSCEICLNIPDIINLGCFDPCQGLDPLLESVIQPEMEGLISDVFVNAEGEGLLINVFSNQITKDFGCIDIPEVRECEAAQSEPLTADGRGINALLYLLPLALAAGFYLRLRRG